MQTPDSDFKIKKEQVSVKDTCFNFNKFFNKTVKNYKNKIEIKIHLSLEEAFTGSFKKISYDYEGAVLEFEHNIPKGCLPNQSFLIKQDKIPLPVFFKVIIKKHDFYRIEGKTVISYEKINLFKALLGGTYQVHTLEGPLVIDLPNFSLDKYSIILNKKGLSGGHHIIFFKPVIPEINDNMKEKIELLYAESESESK